MKKMFYLLFALTIMISGCGSTESKDSRESITLSVALLASENHTVYDALVAMHEELQEKTNGRIGLEIYTSAVLGDELEAFQQLQSGTVDLYIYGIKALAAQSDAFAAWYMPNIFASKDHMYTMAQTDEALSLIDAIDNVVALGHTASLKFMVGTKEEPITKVSDFAGKKIRTASSPEMMAWLSTLGASPVEIPASEVYTSFQTGVFDAATSDASFFAALSLYEIAKHFTVFFHEGYAPLLMNEDKWNRLSESDRQILKQAGENFTTYVKENHEKNAESYIEQIKNGGGQFHELQDKDVYEEIANKFREGYMNKNEQIKVFVNKALEMKKEFSK